MVLGYVQGGTRAVPVYCRGDERCKILFSVLRMLILPQRVWWRMVWLKPPRPNSRAPLWNRPPACVNPALPFLGCRMTGLRLSGVRTGRLFPKIGLISLLPVPVDLPGVEG